MLFSFAVNYNALMLDAKVIIYSDMTMKYV